MSARAAPDRDAATKTPSAERCAWCGTSFDEHAECLQGRVVCGTCGVATTSPWPSEVELEAAYGDWYRPSGGRFSGVGDALLRMTRGRLARRIDRCAPQGRVLDVGCGEGVLLDALKSRGREAVGLERVSTRPDVLEDELADVRGPWAAVVFWHSLEHLREPGAAIDHAAGMLAPRGLLVIAVPNSASLQAQAFKDRWFALDLPRHLVHLSARALIERIRAAGLEPKRVSHLRGGQVVFGWLHGLVGRLPGGLDLYDAIRRPSARMRPIGRARRAAAIAAGAALAPVAAELALFEALARRGGTVYVEARRDA